VAKRPDPVTRYAEQVRDGHIVASRLVKQACARHLRDLAQQSERGLVWNPFEAGLAIDFFPEVLCLPETSDGMTAGEERLDGVPFVLQPWQQFIVGSLFGWYLASGYRRFKTAYIETAKGSGKTPLGAGLLIRLALADGQARAQVFAAAVTREQARLAFSDCEAMVNASPYLRAEFRQTANNLAVPSTGSFIRAISSEKRGLDGKRVHGALIDELHEHPTHVVVNKMRAGLKGQLNGLILEITNSGFDRTSVCWSHHEYSRRVLSGAVTDETWFAFVCGLDPCDVCADAGKWFPDESCSRCDDWRVEGSHWLKACPNLGVSVPWQYVRDRVHTAKQKPDDVSDVLRFNFCVWTQSFHRAISMPRWMGCQPMPSDSELVGSPCYGGIDLGESEDFSAWCRGWVLDDGRIAVKLRFWLPERALEKHPDRPYAEWQRAGLLTITEGDVIDYAVVGKTIFEDCMRDGVLEVAYDPRAMTETAQTLEGRGVSMVKTPQGFQLWNPLKKTLELIAEGTLCHGHNLILSWMASNVVLRNGLNGEKKIDKDHAPDKIDGFAAIVTMMDRVVRNAGQAESAYADHGLVVV
jgi:phage terminase large subunit-like protein